MVDGADPTYSALPFRAGLRISSDSKTPDQDYQYLRVYPLRWVSSVCSDGSFISKCPVPRSSLRRASHVLLGMSSPSFLALASILTCTQTRPLDPNLVPASDQGIVHTHHRRDLVDVPHSTYLSPQYQTNPNRQPQDPRPHPGVTGRANKRRAHLSLSPSLPPPASSASHHPAHRRSRTLLRKWRGGSAGQGRRRPWGPVVRRC